MNSPSRFSSVSRLVLTLAALLVGVTATTGAEGPDTIPSLVVPTAWGKNTYTNVRIMGTTEQGVKVVHDGGIAVVPFRHLPENLQAKYAAPEATAPAKNAMAAATASPTMRTTEDSNPEAKKSSEGSSPSTGKGFDLNCLVFIKTDSGSGSGFVVNVAGKTYIYTNAHVLCGAPGGFTKKIVSIKTAAGRSFPTPYDLELSAVYDAAAPNGLEDMARFPVTLKPGEPAYEFAAMDSMPKAGQKVVAYGNSMGEDVMTTLDGNIMGLGTDRIEVSCEIVPGNSGGPVIFPDTNEVVGISTYLATGKRDIWTQGTQFSQVRRFAIRPEKVTKWRKMLYTSLISSLAELSAFDRDTLSLAAACFLNPRPNRGGFDVPSHQNGDYVVRQVLMDGTKHELGGTISGGITRVNQRLAGAGGTVAMMTVVPVFAEFFGTVAAVSSAQMSSIRNGDRAPYVKQFIPQLLELRGEIHKVFVQQGNTRFR